MSIDLDKIAAIDVHTHAEVGRTGEDGLKPEWREAAQKYFGEGGKPTVEEVAAYYRERNIAAVVFTVDAETVTGRPAVRNEEIAEVAAANADVLIPFASIDPHKRGAVDEARRLIRDHRVRGFKFHPNIQAFFLFPSPAGRRSTSRRRSSATRTRSCATASSSAPTTR
jgi:uncharacterized protein